MFPCSEFFLFWLLRVFSYARKASKVRSVEKRVHDFRFSDGLLSSKSVCLSLWLQMHQTCALVSIYVMRERTYTLRSRTATSPRAAGTRRQKEISRTRIANPTPPTFITDRQPRGNVLLAFHPHGPRGPGRRTGRFRHHPPSPAPRKTSRVRSAAGGRHGGSMEGD